MQLVLLADHPIGIPHEGRFLACITTLSLVNDRVHYSCRLYQSLILMPVSYNLNTDWSVLVLFRAGIFGGMCQLERH